MSYMPRREVFKPRAIGRAAPLLDPLLVLELGHVVATARLTELRAPAQRVRREIVDQLDHQAALLTEQPARRTDKPGPSPGHPPSPRHPPRSSLDRRPSPHGTSPGDKPGTSTTSTSDGKPGTSTTSTSDGKSGTSRKSASPQVRDIHPTKPRTSTSFVPEPWSVDIQLTRKSGTSTQQSPAHPPHSFLDLRPWTSS